MALADGPRTTARSTAAMKGDSDTTLAEFFSAWNSDLPEPVASENIDIQNLFLRRHRRTRFSNWFQLTTRVVDTLVSEVVPDDAGGWRATVEDMTGFRFTRSTAPDSYSLINASVKSEGGHVKFVDKTLGTKLLTTSESSVFDVEIPDECFAHINPDPTFGTITERELSLFTDKLLEYVAEKYGSITLGVKLARHLARKAEKRLPALPNRKGRSGQHRDLTNILVDKSRNRSYVSLSPSNLPSLTPSLTPSLNPKSIRSRRRSTRRGWSLASRS